jgi:hypothetical protein
MGFLDSVRSALTAELKREEPWILALQRLRTPVLDAFMNVASNLGEEMFYITALPGSVWFIDKRLGRDLGVVMGLTICVGNILKNILRIPRPRVPPVWCNDKNRSDDPGIPSTHTMSHFALPLIFLAHFYHFNVPSDSWISFHQALGLSIAWSLRCTYTPHSAKSKHSAKRAD